MKILSNFVGLMAILCVIDGANAAGGLRKTTGDSAGRERVSMASTTAAMRRLPTMILTKNVSTTTSTSTASSDSSLMDTTECVDAYTECIKATDVCGFDFEECTTHELFYAKKPQCNNILLQCSTAGINTLFGTTSITNLTADNMEVYPTQGSILGQFIEAGAINNRLDKSSCVKRYTSCLKKESVCGEDFELCTSDTEFKKQKIYCESTLARCTDDGKTELFGQTNTDMAPKADSRLRIMITEGAQLASVNAVSTCYKVADQCILSACSANPYKCIVDSTFAVVNATDDVNENAKTSTEDTASNTNVITTSLISRYIKSACAETIGGNKYCYMTANEGKVPTASQITDLENQEEVYADIYAARMNTILRDKIKKIADGFDKKAKDKCSDAITACAMRSCGSGLGSACYAKVFSTGASSDDFKNSINGDSTYAEIQTGCESIVNTDANCKYAAASVDNKTYSYEYNESGAFDILFPVATTGKDPIGVVSRLNAALAENYNNAAIERMAKQCKNTAVSCIRSLCGADFKNCYRNRTDVMTDTYATEEEKFNQSMNKVGGVLDFTIVRGLCLETVKNADVCDEHLKIQVIRNYTDGNGNTGWGENKTVRDAWVGAVSSGYSAKLVDIEGEVVETGLCLIDKSTASEKCRNKTDAMQCDYVDEDGCLYSVDQLVPRKDYQLSMAADTLFQEVMGDLEKEAQAKYNAKLTAEQHMCVDANSGGIMGRNDHSAAYMWAKLKNRKVPKDYATNGLKANAFDRSNDLYGSFCRARVTIQSDDPDVQTVLQKGQNWATTYFAVGDVFTCGSWIPQDKLQEIAEKVAAKKLGKSVEDAKEGKMSTGQKWATAAATIGSAGLGVAGMELLQSRTGLGGLLSTSSDSVDDCTIATDNEIARWEAIKGSMTANAACGKDEQGADLKCLLGYIRENDGLIRKSNASKTVSKYKYKQVTGGTNNLSISETWIDAHIEEVQDYKRDVCGSMSNGRMWGRVGMDVLGGAATATLGGLATGQNIKAANRQKFNEAQQEFMNNVGNHIYCFIGADEAGTYGDLIEISID